MFMYIVPLHFCSVHAGFGAAVVAGVVFDVAFVVFDVAVVVAFGVVVDFGVVVVSTSVVTEVVAAVVSEVMSGLFALVGAFSLPAGVVDEYDETDSL